MFDDRIMDEKLNEKCGVFGVYNDEQAVNMTYYALHALQHRGQESAGIVASDKEKLSFYKGAGLVFDVFGNGQLDKLQGSQAVGHVKYGVVNEGSVTDAQPLVFKYRVGTIALAHNGELVNAAQIRRYLEMQGSIFQTDSDTEVIAHLIARSPYDDLDMALKEALSMIKGSYALLIMNEDQLIAARDPNGIRPLSMAKSENGYCFSSETCAFDIAGAEYIRDIEPGEMVIVDQQGIRTVAYAQHTKHAVCSFEYIYFARPDSNINGVNVHQARRQLGIQLATEHPAEADLVLGVPDSSISSAIGYAEALGIPYELGLVKNRYVGRTFIRPNQETRALGVKMKLSVIRKVVEGKRVVMVDDSIVRGTTSSLIVGLLRDAGAKEVHVRISSPPVAYSCFYGIDTSARDELIVASKTMEEIREFIQADSLEFLSIDGLIHTINPSETKAGNHGLCLACFTGKYPTEIYPQDNGGGSSE